MIIINKIKPTFYREIKIEAKAVLVRTSSCKQWLIFAALGTLSISLPKIFRR